MTPKLTVVIPTFNEAAHITLTLADIAPLRATGDEVIVVDGGSGDGTGELAAPLADRVLVTDAGRARQMNAGARHARGEWLWFLHADTRISPDALAALRGALSASVVWGRFDVRLSGRPRMLRVVERAMNRRSRLTGIATGDQGIFVARAAFSQIGGYPDIPLMEDIALSRALCRLGRPACLKAPLVASGRRWEAHGPVRTIALMWGLRLAYALGASPWRLVKWYYR